ncbi:anthrone oxygenase family protein [Maricaulis sp.]|uniref:anthrone oxygenase family protein n=1 Tax=Maricaulis sp. TaxID=1486257 RepID=UPI0025B838A2|nr:anthrone oxygenase family protein [Maricaulis sp.]
MTILTLAALGLGLIAGLVAGIFFAFSDFIMRGLAAASVAAGAPAGAGAEAMRGINRSVYSSKFLLMLKALPLLALALAAAAFLLERHGMAVWFGFGAVSHIVLVMLSTLTCNVPMNTRLQSLAGDAQATAAYWPDYVSRWTGWNHVRTVGAMTSCCCFLLATTA